jgi:hypothetical protein
VGLVLAVAGLAALLAAFWKPITGYATTGAAYGARVGCSCHFVAGRSLADCRKDFVSGMGLVTLSADPAEKRVTAWLPLLARQSAQLRPGEGCLLEPWRD